MAKKRAKSRKKSVPSLKAPLARALREAQSLKGRVTQTAELNKLIQHLQTVQKAAAASCPTRTFSRSFSVISKTSKTSKKR